MSADEEHIDELDAHALVRDAGMVELIEEIEGLCPGTMNRAVVEQAKGIVMEMGHCGLEAASAVLVAQAHQQNRKLGEFAAELVALQGRSPPPPPQP